MAVSQVVQDLGLLSNPYGPASQGEWNLARGVYFNDKLPQGLVFFFETRQGEPLASRTGLESIEDAGGRRLAVYEYAYKDGQRLKDLGRKGETFTFNVKFFGTNYQERFNEFIAKVCRSESQGKLVHPVRGTFTVRFKDWNFVHRHDEWNSVTIKALFLEDTDIEVANAENTVKISSDSALRDGIQKLALYESSLRNSINALSTTLNLPNTVQSVLKGNLSSITGQVSRLIGQLTATFSLDSTQQQLSAQAAATDVGSITAVNSGTVTSGTTTVSQLPPVFQTGLDQTTADYVNAQTDAFVNANQITPQQAVFQSNKARSESSIAIQNLNTSLGNNAYPLVLQYRAMMNSMQETVETCISSSQNKVNIYVTPRTMSIRSILFNLGLDYNRQNEMAQLNPYLASINFIPQGSSVLVPSS